MRTKRPYTRILTGMALATLCWAPLHAEVIPALPGHENARALGKRYFRNADWARARTVRLEVDGESYITGKSTWHRGKPHKLVIENSGDKRLVLAAPEFFNTSAVRELHTGSGGLVTPFFDSLVLEPFSSITLLLVPTEAGVFDVRYWPEENRERELLTQFEVLQLKRSLY